jgi:NADPH:quinone reductase-like Zn-dependent oxidoreductase
MAGSGETLTYAELEERSAQLADHLRTLGLRTGDVVALLTDNRPQACEVYWACQRAGLYVTAVNWHLTPAEAAYIVGDCGARVLIASAGLADLAKEVLAATPSLTDTLAFAGAIEGFGDYEAALAAAERAAGARVTATVRNEDARSEVERLGASEAIDPEGFEEHGPFDVVLELVGAPNLPSNLKALATNGRIVVIGVSAGAKAELNLLALMGKRARIMASTLRARPLEEKAATARALEREVLPLFARGELRVPVAETFALQDVAAAYERFAGGGKLGKVLLEL